MTKDRSSDMLTVSFVAVVAGSAKIQFLKEEPCDTNRVWIVTTSTISRQSYSRCSQTWMFYRPSSTWLASVFSTPYGV